MAIFNQPSTAKRDTAPLPPEPSFADSALKKQPDPTSEFSFGAAVPQASPAPAAAPAPQRAPEPQLKESLIAADLTIEGKIQGAGHIRIAGKFKGDVDVQGDLTIEVGAKLDGGVRARKVTIAGELDGNIEQAQHVELLASGAMTGDLKANTVNFANGSRMRGQVDFGFGDDAPRTGKAKGTPEAAGTA